ncbi:MAG: c-type cytochrome [Planctomycetes bacterium]|nr:c-type cytochrome [Planctomycetota bacterium]
MHFIARSCGLVVALALVGSMTVQAQQPKPAIPHAQDKPPNDPRDPQTAARMMTVPEGFTVEVVAAEPDIVNPVAMAIDERGRFWITESLEYPRREPGPGKDRVKILEDTDGDGQCDKFTVFMEGLNIPSGIAVGHGGVWIANSPDILFVQDTDGDGKADKQEVVVTGFGRTDTHELPNSLTWGPDGWLYGLNGVFNHSHVKYSETNPNYSKDHKGWPLTCALYRIHPRTREFQVFCEGTSNPWGIAFNEDGEAFISACVIDHLWHLVETGYYHRQGGPYPPFTWKIESIVKHKHQKAAYCGIHYFDSDAYPDRFRGKLYMGNIHGGCINVDSIERDGATYKGTGEPDFLTANDAWFMPVVQKTGPDGSLYVLDWYDRYHCYQDANRDPAGIDRLKGRLYRVRYKETPRAPKDLDLAKESDEQLIERLGAMNDFIRWTATRLLQERTTPKLTSKLLQLVFAPETIPTQRRHALFASMPDLLRQSNWNTEQVSRLLDSPDDVVRAWAVRLLVTEAVPVVQRGNADENLQAKSLQIIQNGLTDRSSTVRLQSLIYVARMAQGDGRGSVQFPMDNALLAAVRLCGHDPVLQRTAWQAIKAYGAQSPKVLSSLLTDKQVQESPIGRELTPRLVEWLLAQGPERQLVLGEAFQSLLASNQTAAAGLILSQLAAKVQTGEIKGDTLNSLKGVMSKPMSPLLADQSAHPLAGDAALLAVSWGDPRGLPQIRRLLSARTFPSDQRLKALNALIATQDAQVLKSVAAVLTDNTEPADFKSQILLVVGRIDDPKVAGVMLGEFPKMEPDLQSKTIELLTQRAAWARQLLTAIGDKQIPATVINLNQARRLKELKDEELTKLLATHWGQVREGRDPNREQYIASMKALIRQSPGDPLVGEKAFKKVCAQCHKIYGEGVEVGPDITRNGRNDFTQLLSNVFDPSLVIGAGYRSYTVVTNGGRVLNGLLAEDSPQRVVLKIQGGKQEVIARSDIDEIKVSEISLMPEQLEKQLSPQEIVDLFAFITLDKHPSDPSAKRLPGVSQVSPRQSLNPAEFSSLVGEILPGFTTAESGELGIGLLAEHQGHENVLRTHPVSRDKPCVLTMKLTPPADKKTKLILEVSHDPRGDWRLVVRGNGERMADEMISKETCTKGWRTITVDLSKFAGKELKLDLVNQANDWSWEFGFWGSARIVSE